MTAPDATAGDGLRDLREGIARLTGYAEDSRTVQAFLALPALRDVLAAAARDAEKVRRVRELHAPVMNWTEPECEACSTVCGDDDCIHPVPSPCPTIRALDAP